MKKMIIPDNIKFVINKIKENNGEVYIVGGPVRDYILLGNPHDFDLTTSLLPNEIIKIFDGYKFINNNGIKHDTISIKIDDDIIEITSFRVNEKTKNRCLKEDILIRDFTINALTYDGENIIDYVGGINDIKNKVIKAVGDPYERFSEDYLRILRALRFSSKLGFKIDDKTKEAMINCKFGLDKISKERILSELLEILVGDNVFNVLIEFKEIFSYLIKDLTPCIGFDQKSKYHTHYVYDHIAYVVSYAKKDKTTRLAALLHDIGKPVCFQEEIKDGKVIRHFHKHPVKSYDLSIDILYNLGVSNKMREDVLFLVLYHDVYIEKTKKSVKKILSKIPNNDLTLFDKLLDLKKADQKDHINLEDFHLANVEDLRLLAKQIIEEKEAFSLKDLAINGNDIKKLGYKNKEIGDALDYLLEQVISGNVNNNKEDLINKLNDFKK